MFVILDRFTEAFVPLLVAVDPIGLLPVFVSITATMERRQKREITILAVLAAVTVTLTFMFLGQGIFRLLGITLADFQVAGGLLLLLLAISDLLLPGKPTVHDLSMVGLVPLAMPLIAGPAVLTTVLVLASRPDLGYGYTTAALLAICGLLLAMMLGAAGIVRLVGTPALGALSKLVMVLLAAIAVSYVRSGIVLMVANH